MRSARLRAFVVGVGALLLAAGAPADRTLRVAMSSPPRPFDPAIAGSFEELQPVLGAYEQLVARDRMGRFSPEVASSWSSSPDRLTWTFALGAGHRFEDGNPVDAAAVKYSLDRLLALGRTPSSDLGQVIKSVAAVRPDELRITLNAPAPRLLDMLADRSASIVNPSVQRHAVNGDWGSGWLASRSAGSGPYRLQGTSDGQLYRLGRNPVWSGPRPYFDALVYQTIPDPNVRALSVVRGEVDIALLMPAQVLRRLRASKQVKVVTAPILAFQNLAFNLDRPVWSDVRRRRAVAAAIDTQAIVTHIRSGTASPFYGPLAPGMAGADPALYLDRFDPVRAKSLAAVALKSPVTVVMIYPGVSPETDTVAQYIQAVLAPLGVRVRLERLSVAAYTNRIQRGAYDLVLMGAVPRNDDPSGILGSWFDPARIGEENPARYNNSVVTALIRQAAAERDPVRQAQLNRRIAMIVNADLPYVYLQQNRIANITRADITGYSIDPLAAISLPFDTLERRR